MHELVRRLLTVFNEYNPAADETWLMRSVGTEISAFVQAKYRVYGEAANEDMQNLLRFIIAVVTERMTTAHEIDSMARMRNFETTFEHETGAWPFGGQIFEIGGEAGHLAHLLRQSVFRFELGEFPTHRVGDLA